MDKLSALPCPHTNPNRYCSSCVERTNHNDWQCPICGIPLMMGETHRCNEAVRRGDDPWGKQEGGSHYTKRAIQPFEYSMKNGLDPLQHTIIKYVTRFRDKNCIEDLKKARHCIDLLIAYEENK